jgi:hypothetical protein
MSTDRAFEIQLNTIADASIDHGSGFWDACYELVDLADDGHRLSITFMQKHNKLLGRVLKKLGDVIHVRKKRCVIIEDEDFHEPAAYILYQCLHFLLKNDAYMQKRLLNLCPSIIPDFVFLLSHRHTNTRDGAVSMLATLTQHRQAFKAVKHNELINAINEGMRLDAKVHADDENNLNATCFRTEAAFLLNALLEYNPSVAEQIVRDGVLRGFARSIGPAAPWQLVEACVSIIDDTFRCRNCLCRAAAGRGRGRDVTKTWKSRIRVACDL